VVTVVTHGATERNQLGRIVIGLLQRDEQGGAGVQAFCIYGKERLNNMFIVLNSSREP
jgi:hypothetical protein